MQIALTKKLADAMALKLPSASEGVNPLFSWTANWTRVWENQKADDMLVLVNNATRFTVAIYQVKRKDVKRAPQMMMEAIKNTLLALNLNPEMIEEYFRLAGELELRQNRNRQTASWVSRAGLECAWSVADEYSDTSPKFNDTIGLPVNYGIVNVSGKTSEAYYPYKAMADALAELTGKQPYHSHAFELLVTLDLKVYKAERRIIVPTNMTFTDLHEVLQFVYDWEEAHLYEFTILDRDQGKPNVTLVPFEESLEFDENAVLMEEQQLSEFLTKQTQVIYTYDFGDHWEHKIQLVREIKDYGKELPYLLEANGQAPPEDVGGVGGFIHFREIMLDSSHPEHEEMKEWSDYWSTELSDWDRQPKVIRI